MATCNACRKIGFNAWQRNADTHVKTLPRHGKRAAKALATAKTRHTHGKDIGKSMAKVWQRRSNNMATKQQRHGTNMARAWQTHWTSIAMAWPHQGTRHGKGIAQALR
jgi:hypothetical protein